MHVRAATHTHVHTRVIASPHPLRAPRQADDPYGGAVATVVTPAPISTVLYEMMPLDVIADTAEQLRTGFGLTHKWEKRRAQVRGDAQRHTHTLTEPSVLPSVRPTRHG